MIVTFSDPDGEVREVKCNKIEEGEHGVILYDIDGRQIAYIKYKSFYGAVPEDEN